MKPSKFFNGVVFSVLLACAGAQAQALRPEIGKPLQQAGELLKAGKTREALAKVQEADGVSGKTANEQFLIDRMRGSAAQRAGDNATAARAFEAVFASGKLSGAEQAQVAESLANAYAQLHDWPKTTQWIQKAQQAGSNSAQLKQLQAYVQSQNGDYAAIARDASAAVSAAEQAGRRPGEDDLLRLADASLRTNNAPAHAAALEKLVAYYPKKEYWSAYLGRLPRRPGFSDRFGLDVMRLRLATGNLATADDYMEMAQLSLQAGLPAEGKKIVEQGFTSKVLGVGAEAGRHQRLRDLATKQEAEQRAGLDAEAAKAARDSDGSDLVQAGIEYASFGDVDRGVALIQQGIAKGGLKRPDDAKLRLGQAQLQSPKTKSQGLQTLRSVQGKDGAADIARLDATLAGGGQ